MGKAILPPLGRQQQQLSDPERKERALKLLEKNLSIDSLEILAEKSKLPGINTIIKNYKNLL